MEPTVDRFGRALANLRVSVTDRCNLRCAYCMPEEEYKWLPRDRLLRFEEIARLVGVFITLGVEKVRLTGGEPLLRHDLPKLVAMLAKQPGLRELAMTTNGVLLAEHARALASAGLGRVTISLDTLDESVFQSLTRRPGLDRVLAGVESALEHWPGKVKIDTVVMRGTNHREMVPLLDYARSIGAELRFIEYMDVGGATRWNPETVVSREEVLDVLGKHFGEIEPMHERSTAPAERFRLSDGTIFGIIASTTAPFCRTCDRARLTADGMWFLCLYARLGLDLCALVRSSATDEEIARRIAATWRTRDDRGAETRLEELRRGPLVGADTLRDEPHLEMHTRGG